MTESKKLKIFEDIFDSRKIKSTELQDYFFYSEDNIIWLYSPLIVRGENESLIAGWSYVFGKEDIILSSQTYIYSEDKINNSQLRPFINKGDLSVHYRAVEEIINKNKQMIPDELFAGEFKKTLHKYSIEVIVQQRNYRVRIRPLLVQEISYDVYYDSKADKLIFNTFNP